MQALGSTHATRMTEEHTPDVAIPPVSANPDAEEPTTQPDAAADAPAAEPQADGSSAPPDATGAEPGAEPETPAEAPAEAPGDTRKPRRPPRDPGVARAYRLGLPVEGRVEGVIKGGYEVRVGRSRGFCPHSQMELQRVGTPEEHVGKTYSFRILQMRRGGEDLVLSRRALLEAEKAEEAKAVRATLLEGTVMLGRVAGLADFGAFVDLGAGVMGLVHVSELSHARVERVSDALSVGDRVRVKILKLDEESGRISLSIRQAEEDPWLRATERFAVGTEHTGTVLRLSQFGAFVDLGNGIEALAAAREYPPSKEGWQAGLEVGAEGRFTVLSVDPGRRRISLAPALPGDRPTAPPAPGAKLTGRVQKAERFGVFVWLGPGQVGLVPAASTGVPRGVDLGRRFPVGDEIEVEVVESTEDGRIRLALPGVTPVEQQPPQRAARPPRGEGGQGRPDRGPRRERDRDRERGRGGGARGEDLPAPPPGAGGPESFGTSLGDVLRAAFRKKDET